ncbi:hypothetical protein L2729_04430 [Shewanella gelidimarina]|uniref:hypothetical protein n=1 Tax=Shewanella gelidimarina TaxID=56813 RepID=UPI00200D6825|nr:hypothetical protein [Shewanella gelidimarina]MCL1057240.1 hypothetical protein [Shewanella gelidimarina]
MRYDPNKYQILQLPSPLLLFWAINPVLAINELVLGQRLPEVMLIEKHSKQPLSARQVVPCPHCHAMNPGMLWSNGNAFGHWFGYVCPECSGVIPCLWNFTSLLLLTLSAPLWWLMKQPLKKRWLARSYQKVTAMKANPPTPNKNHCSIKIGQTFAVTIFLLMLLIPTNEPSWSLQQAGISLLLSSFLGVMFAQLMALIMSRSKKRY